MTLLKKSKIKERMLVDDNINDLIKRNEKELTAQQKKIEEIEKKLLLLKISNTKDRELWYQIPKRCGKLNLNLPYCLNKKAALHSIKTLILILN